MKAWIRMLEDHEADEPLMKVLDQCRAPDGSVGNVMRVHSLRPHTMIGHHTLYMSALHNDGNTVPEWLQETVASYTSILNNCHYSLTNHWSNAAHLIGDPERAAAIRAALDAHKPELAFDGKELEFLRYARKLTLSPGDMCEADIKPLRDAGADDGEILEINQVCCYFNYVNRALNGLGVSLKGTVVGYYASPDDVYTEDDG